MGQEYGQVHEWAENKALDWEDLEKPAHRQMQNYTKALIQLYKTHPALWKLDYDSDGFEWINCVEWEKSMVTFLRKSQKQEDTLVVICNTDDYGDVRGLDNKEVQPGDDVIVITK